MGVWSENIVGRFDIRIIVIELATFLFAITVHESSHAATANYFGDPTAKRLGRISLNPWRHIDIFGTVILPIILTIIGAPVIGWAKPVPVNPTNLRQPRRDYMLVSVAGPASNLAMACIFAGAFYLLRLYYGFLPSPIVQPISLILQYSCIINLYLALFNMIPVQPLDGSSVLACFLPRDLAAKFMSFQSYGFIVLYLLVYLGVLQKVINPVAGFILNLLGLR